MFAPLTIFEATSNTCCRETFAATPTAEEQVTFAMVPLQVVFLTCTLFFGSIDSLEDIATSDRPSSEEETNQKQNKIKKRLIYLPTRPQTELALLQAGILTADYTLFGDGDPTFGTQMENDYSHMYLQQPYIQQGYVPLVSKNPTKPVYHYTPLPAGTFRVNSKQTDKINDETQSSNNHYWYNYLVQDENHGLDMGRMETRNGNTVRGMYHVLLPDQRMQVVKYWSDLSGFHPTVSYIP